MIDASFIGRTFAPHSADVEAGRLRLFAKATGETRPEYVDDAAARAAGHPALPAPPTFAVCLDLEVPDPFAWFRELGIDLGRVLHAAEGFRYPSEMLAVDPVSNLPVRFALLGTGQDVQPLRTAADYDRFLKRMDGFVAWVDQAINNLRSGVAKGVVYPRTVVERTLPPLAEVGVADPKQSLFWKPILNFPAGLSVADRRRLLAAYEDKLGKQGMKLLFTVPWPPQGIYTKRTLASVTDMKGLKWRAYSPATAKIAELVGAQPVTVQAAEVSQALATGVIDSYMSSGATGYDSKTYEHIANWYDTQAWLPKNAIIVNQKAFDALDKPTQAALLKVAAEAEARGWKLSEEKNGWYVDQLKAKGMSIVKPSEQLTADLRKVGNYMLAEWLRKAGDDGRKVIDAYRAM